MNEHGIIVPYQTYFYLYRTEVSSLSTEQFKWKKYLEISTIAYIPFLILYYVSLVYSFLPQSLRYNDVILISIAGTISILCIIFIFDSLQKEEPEVFVTLLEFWIGLTILLIFLVVYITKENIELKSSKQAFGNFVTIGNNNEIVSEFFNLYVGNSDRNPDYTEYSGIFNQNNGKYRKTNDNDDANIDKNDENKDKDDENKNKDDDYNDKDDEYKDKDDMDSEENENGNEIDDESQELSEKKETIKKIILKNTLLGFFTLIVHCLIAFFISKVRKTLSEIKNFTESSIELQTLGTK